MQTLNTTVQKYPMASSYQTSPKKNRHAALWVGLGAAAIIMPLVLVSFTLILFQINEWNLPNAFVYDQPVGRMTPIETADLIDRHWNLERQIHVVPSDDPESAAWLSPVDLGYWVDPVATAVEVYTLGRGTTPLQDVAAALKGEQRVVLPVLYFDEAAARQTLQNLSADLSIPPEEAAVAYRDGTWVAIPGSAGRTLDIETTLDHLQADAFTNLVAQSVTLYLQSVPPQVVDMAPVLGDIEQVVSQDLRLAAYDPITDETLTWSVPTEVKRSWIAIDPKTHQVTLDIHQDSLTDLIRTWEAELGGTRSLADLPELDAIITSWKENQVVRATLYHAPTTYQVGSGESLWGISLKLGIPMWYIMDANQGLTTTNLEAGMTLTIPSRNDLLPLPVIPNKRIVIDISQQRMTVLEDGQVRNTYIVSTGVSDSPTMAGIFQVQTHELNAYASNWDLYMPHFLGIYEAWPGFMNGIHGLPLLSSGTRLWASTLGSPASYGCIILDLAAAEDLYYWADPGVVVEITR